MADERWVRPLPQMSSWTRGFWESIRAHRLAVQFCPRCERSIHPPLPICPGCGKAALEWRVTSGLGRVVSFTIVHRAPMPAFKPPYAVGLVLLHDAAARVLSNIVECDLSQLAVGMEVRAVFEDVNEQTSLFMFAPVVPSVTRS